MISQASSITNTDKTTNRQEGRREFAADFMSFPKKMPRKNASGQNQSRTQKFGLASFFYPDYTVDPGISPGHGAGWSKSSKGNRDSAF
jgi:hypothetical protein